METKRKSSAAVTVALMIAATLLSKVLGMLRSIMLASHYGTGMEANAFSQASHIPLTFFDLLFSAAIVGCFIPVYNGFREENRAERTRFACTFLNTVLLLCTGLALLGILFAEPIIAWMAPGFDSETAALAVRLLRIMFPMILFTGSTYTLVGIMQSRGKYLLPAAISAISNAAIIVYFLFLDGRFGEASIYYVAIAYLFAWSLQLVTLALPLLRSGDRLKPILDLRNRAFLQSMRMLPAIMIGSWLSPISLLIGLRFSSLTVVPGAVTVFDYANSVYIMIAGTLSYSICNYIFPKLSRLNSAGSSADFATTTQSSLLSALFLVLPFTAGAFLLSEEGVSLLYLRNAFTAADAANTSQALRCLVLAVPAFAIIELLGRVFYARQMPIVPMIAALVGVVCNLLFTLLLLSVTSLGISAVALANALGQYAAAITLLCAVRRKLPGILTSSMLSQFLRMLLCTALAFLVMAFISGLFANQPYQVGSIRNILVLMAVFLPGALVYLGAARLLKINFPLSR